MAAIIGAVWQIWCFLLCTEVEPSSLTAATGCKAFQRVPLQPKDGTVSASSQPQNCLLQDESGKSCDCILQRGEIIPCTGAVWHHLTILTVESATAVASMNARCDVAKAAKKLAEEFVERLAPGADTASKRPTASYVADHAAIALSGKAAQRHELRQLRWFLRCRYRCLSSA